MQKHSGPATNAIHIGGIGIAINAKNLTVFCAGHQNLISDTVTRAVPAVVMLKVTAFGATNATTF